MRPCWTGSNAVTRSHGDRDYKEGGAQSFKKGATHPLHLGEDFFADPDYSEFDCIDDEPADASEIPQAG